MTLSLGSTRKLPYSGPFYMQDGGKVILGGVRLLLGGGGKLPVSRVILYPQVKEEAFMIAISLS